MFPPNLNQNNSTPRNISQRFEYRYSNRYLYKNVHGSCVHKRHKVEITQKSINNECIIKCGPSTQWDTVDP